MTTGKRLTPQQRAKIIELLAKGATPTAVAARMGCARNSVYAVVKATKAGR